MRTKKIFEKCSAFLRENPRANLGTVIKPRVAKEITNRSGHAGLVIPCTEYHSTHTSQNQSARAHCARLEGHVQRAVVQSPAVKLRRGFTYREDFCVRCGILVPHCPIRSRSDDGRISHDHRANRNFVSAGCLAREIERIPDILLVDEACARSPERFCVRPAIGWQPRAQMLSGR